MEDWSDWYVYGLDPRDHPDYREYCGDPEEDMWVDYYTDMYEGTDYSGQNPNSYPYVGPSDTYSNTGRLRKKIRTLAEKIEELEEDIYWLKGEISGETDSKNRDKMQTSIKRKEDLLNKKRDLLAKTRQELQLAESKIRHDALINLIIVFIIIAALLIWIF